MRKLDFIAGYIKSNWSSSAIINAWNRYCEDNNDPDSMVEYMDSFNELFDGMTPTEIAERVSHGSFCSGDDYWCFNAYGNIKTFSYWDDSDSPVDIYDVAEWLIDNGDSDTEEIDTDDLAEGFLDEYFPDDDRDKMEHLIDIYCEEECFDILTEDWDDLAANLKYALEKYDTVINAIENLNGEDCIALDEIPFYGENGEGKALGISKDEDGNTQIGYDINGFLFIDKVELDELPYGFISDVADGLNN
mgnify:CR=1 FL=1